MTKIIIAFAAGFFIASYGVSGVAHIADKGFIMIKSIGAQVKLYD